MLRERELVQIKKKDKWTKGECNSNWSKRRKEIIGPKKNEFRIGPNEEKRSLDQGRTNFVMVQIKKKENWTKEERISNWSNLEKDRIGP